MGEKNLAGQSNVFAIHEARGWKNIYILLVII
jgi:hypothetical protein